MSFPPHLGGPGRSGEKKNSEDLSVLTSSDPLKPELESESIQSSINNSESNAMNGNRSFSSLVPQHHIVVENELINSATPSQGSPKSILLRNGFSQRKTHRKKISFSDVVEVRGGSITISDAEESSDDSDPALQHSYASAETSTPSRFSSSSENVNAVAKPEDVNVGDLSLHYSHAKVMETISESTGTKRRDSPVSQAFETLEETEVISFSSNEESEEEMESTSTEESEDHEPTLGPQAEIFSREVHEERGDPQALGSLKSERETIRTPSSHLGATPISVAVPLSVPLVASTVSHSNGPPDASFSSSSSAPLKHPPATLRGVLPAISTHNPTPGFKLDFSVSELFSQESSTLIMDYSSRKEIALSTLVTEADGVGRFGTPRTPSLPAPATPSTPSSTTPKAEKHLRSSPTSAEKMQKNHSIHPMDHTVHRDRPADLSSTLDGLISSSSSMASTTLLGGGSSHRIDENPAVPNTAASAAPVVEHVTTASTAVKVSTMILMESGVDPSHTAVSSSSRSPSPSVAPPPLLPSPVSPQAAAVSPTVRMDTTPPLTSSSQKDITSLEATDAPVVEGEPVNPLCPSRSVTPHRTERPAPTRPGIYIPTPTNKVGGNAAAMAHNSPLGSKNPYRSALHSEWPVDMENIIWYDYLSTHGGTSLEALESMVHAVSASHHVLPSSSSPVFSSVSTKERHRVHGDPALPSRMLKSDEGSVKGITAIVDPHSVLDATEVTRKHSRRRSSISDPPGTSSTVENEKETTKKRKVVQLILRKRKRVGNPKSTSDPVVGMKLVPSSSTGHTSPSPLASQRHPASHPARHHSPHHPTEASGASRPHQRPHSFSSFPCAVIDPVIMNAVLRPNRAVVSRVATSFPPKLVGITPVEMSSAVATSARYPSSASPPFSLFPGSTFTAEQEESLNPLGTAALCDWWRTSRVDSQPLPWEREEAKMWKTAEGDPLKWEMDRQALDALSVRGKEKSADGKGRLLLTGIPPSSPFSPSRSRWNAGGVQSDRPAHSVHATVGPPFPRTPSAPLEPPPSCRGKAQDTTTNVASDVVDAEELVVRDAYRIRQAIDSIAASFSTTSPTPQHPMQESSSSSPRPQTVSPLPPSCTPRVTTPAASMVPSGPWTFGGAGHTKRRLKSHGKKHGKHKHHSRSREKALRKAEEKKKKKSHKKKEKHKSSSSGALHHHHHRSHRHPHSIEEEGSAANKKKQHGRTETSAVEDPTRKGKEIAKSGKSSEDDSIAVAVPLHRPPTPAPLCFASAITASGSSTVALQGEEKETEPRPRAAPEPHLLYLPSPSPAVVRDARPTPLSSPSPLPHDTTSSTRAQRQALIRQAVAEIQVKRYSAFFRNEYPRGFFSFPPPVDSSSPSMKYPGLTYDDGPVEPRGMRGKENAGAPRAALLPPWESSTGFNSNYSSGVHVVPSLHTFSPVTERKISSMVGTDAAFIRDKQRKRGGGEEDDFASVQEARSLSPLSSYVPPSLAVWGKGEQESIPPVLSNTNVSVKMKREKLFGSLPVSAPSSFPLPEEEFRATTITRTLRSPTPVAKRSYGWTPPVGGNEHALQFRGISVPLWRTRNSSTGPFLFHETEPSLERNAVPEETEIQEKLEEKRETSPPVTPSAVPVVFPLPPSSSVSSSSSSSLHHPSISHALPVRLTPGKVEHHPEDDPIREHSSDSGKVSSERKSVKKEENDEHVENTPTVSSEPTPSSEEKKQERHHDPSGDHPLPDDCIYSSPSTPPPSKSPEHEEECPSIVYPSHWETAHAYQHTSMNAAEPSETPSPEKTKIKIEEEEVETADEWVDKLSKCSDLYMITDMNKARQFSESIHLMLQCLSSTS